MTAAHRQTILTALSGIPGADPAALLAVILGSTEGGIWWPSGHSVEWEVHTVISPTESRLWAKGPDLDFFAWWDDDGEFTAYGGGDEGEDGD